jgi:hypothetical protein
VRVRRRGSCALAIVIIVFVGLILACVFSTVGLRGGRVRYRVELGASTQLSPV